jgi:hypothetical protein
MIAIVRHERYEDGGFRENTVTYYQPWEEELASDRVFEENHHNWNPRVTYRWEHRDGIGVN